MVAIVVVVVDVDDEEGEGGGEVAQRRKSNNPNLKGFLSCMNLYHIHIVRMQCFARCMFFGIHIALSLHPHCRYESSCCVSTTEVVCTQMHFRDDSDLS